MDNKAQMTYDQARDYMTSMLVFGIRLGLKHILELLGELGQPQKGMQIFHIAGTNGKGSISSFVAHIVAADDKKVGWFTSPFLIRFTERIRVLAGKAGLKAYGRDDTAGEISKRDFAKHMTTIRKAVDRMVARGFEPPTEFDLITAAAFLHFRQEDCDLIVLETGLGGRLDSTNVIDQPLASIIGTIGHDHQKRLGSTIGLIASEKAGIIKAGVPLFAYTPEDALLSAEEAQSVREVLTSSAKHVDAPIRFIGESDIVRKKMTLDGQVFSFEGERYSTSLFASYQAIHAALAIAATRPYVSELARREGVAAARWPGRLEKVRQDPCVLLDGAHNQEGIKALRDALDSLLDDQPITVMIGMLADKDIASMLPAFFDPPVRPLAHVVCSTPATDRALAAHLLADKVANLAFGGYNARVKTCSDPKEAARLALGLARESKTRLIVFGSLYLVGAVRQVLQHGEPAMTETNTEREENGL